MNRRTGGVLTLATLVLLGSGTAGQRMPDFSGRWIAVSSGYAGQDTRIVQTRTTLKFTSGRDKHSVTYNLDGTPRREPAAAGEERWTSASWKNGTLSLTDTRLTSTSEVRTVQTLSLDSTGRLVLGITRTQLDANRDSAIPLPAPQSKTVLVLKKR